MKYPIHIYRKFTGICLVICFFSSQLSAQLSPGDLSQPHAHLAGIANCTKCHNLGDKVSSNKCLDCHQEIRKRIDERKGYHASSDVKGKECIECHSDHHGRKFQMIRIDPDKFDHTLTGYQLLGAHADQTCRSCHKSEFISDRNIRVKSGTYLGLDPKCLSCHTDYHQGTLSTECASCHGFNKFKPASGFDHMRTRFPLKGKHAQVDCKLCHKISVQDGKEVQKFTGLTFDRCTSCHRDVHDNKFGQNCTKCHSEASFHQIRGMNNFNHALTSYPLQGKHQAVSCTKCHKGGYTQELRHNRCSDCHSDYHAGQLKNQGSSPDCSECHSVLGFERSSYTIEKHNSTPFRLTGAHLATPCFACHKKSSKWSFREIGIRCNDCHKNIHESTLDKKYDPEPACINCHNNIRWSEIEFDHGKTGYKLEGAHLSQSCRSCHTQKSEEGLQVQQFSKLTTACANCHKDPHQKQFGDAPGTSCLKCHDYYDWKAGLFDHNNTAFPLDGKHKDVACNKCHPKVVTSQFEYTLYKLKSFTCESCH